MNRSEIFSSQIMSTSILKYMSSETFHKTFQRSKEPSLIELRGSMECDADLEIPTSCQGKPAVYDENIAFSRKPRTEYDNIVNALTNQLMHYFVDEVSMEKCLAPDIFGEESISEENQEEHYNFLEVANHKNTSSETIASSDMGLKDTISIFKQIPLLVPDQKDSALTTTKSKMKAKEGSKLLSWANSSLKNSVEKIADSSTSNNSGSSEEFSINSESLEDINSPNYFSKYKSRDQNVVVKFKNGNKYEGRISCFMMEGDGIYTWKDGTQFEGSFINGVAEGKGYFSWPDKSWFKGDMKNNLRHGKGICVVQKDDGMVCYFGKWKNGQRNGKGIISFGEYNWYDGKWKNDQMHGYGLRQYPTGSRYEGEWKWGKPHGEGTMVWSQHDTYTGMWRRGKMHGRGTYTWRTFKATSFVFPLQNMYDGFWKNGKRHGPGRLLLASGAIISTVWANDLKDGPGQIICKNGLVLESPFLFSQDKLGNIGKPLVIPPWNKWYYDFLLPYQDGIAAPIEIDSDNFYVCKVQEKQLGNMPIKMSSVRTKRKMCLNNIPLLASVETMPLWKFIEMSYEKECTIKNENGSLYITEAVMKSMSFEELWLRKVLSNRLPDINIVYQHYAKLGSEEAPDYNCFLLRFMLWQLCLDSGIKYSSFTLRSLDNTQGFGGYPFDVVPLFQMISYLLYLTYDICIKNRLFNNKIPGFWGGAFDYFISNFVLPGMKKKNEVTYICKWFPINELYSVYKTMGSPVTIIKILNLFSSNDEDALFQNSKTPLRIPTETQGKNLINPDGSIIFIYENNSAVKFRNHMYISELVNLGDIVIRELLISFCPMAVKSPTMIDEDYEVSFLEFCQFTLALLTEYRNTFPQLSEGFANDFTADDEENKEESGNEIGTSGIYRSTQSKTKSHSISIQPREELTKDGLFEPMKSNEYFNKSSDSSLGDSATKPGRSNSPTALNSISKEDDTFKNLEMQSVINTKDQDKIIWFEQHCDEENKTSGSIYGSKFINQGLSYENSSSHGSMSSSHCRKKRKSGTIKENKSAIYESANNLKNMKNELRRDGNFNVYNKSIFLEKVLVKNESEEYCGSKSTISLTKNNSRSLGSCGKDMLGIIKKLGNSNSNSYNHYEFKDKYEKQFKSGFRESYKKFKKNNKSKCFQKFVKRNIPNKRSTKAQPRKYLIKINENTASNKCQDNSKSNIKKINSINNYSRRDFDKNINMKKVTKFGKQIKKSLPFESLEQQGTKSYSEHRLEEVIINQELKGHEENSKETIIKKKTQNENKGQSDLTSPKQQKVGDKVTKTNENINSTGKSHLELLNNNYKLNKKEFINKLKQYYNDISKSNSQIGHRQKEI